MSQITTATLMQMKQQGEKIAVLTSYDASFTRLLENAGVEVILVGDSLGMVIQGQESKAIVGRLAFPVVARYRMTTPVPDQDKHLSVGLKSNQGLPNERR